MFLFALLVFVSAIAPLLVFGFVHLSFFIYDEVYETCGLSYLEQQGLKPILDLVTWQHPDVHSSPAG